MKKLASIRRQYQGEDMQSLLRLNSDHSGELFSSSLGLYMLLDGPLHLEGLNPIIRT